MSSRQEDIISQVRDSMRIGEYLRAYDQACAGLVELENDTKLQYYAVLALARTGATDQAQARYNEFQLNASEAPDTLALGARLVKDKALMSPKADQPELFLKAATLYEDVFKASNSFDSYPAINAATTYYLGNQKAKAHTLAELVLTLCGQAQASYWRYASEAEAHILLGDNDNAVSALENANAYANGNLAALAATKKQLALICDAPSVLNALILPRVIHFAGHIISAPGKPGRFLAEDEKAVAKQIETLLDELDVGIGYGSLASGADIMIAEAILARGGEIHVTLPFELEEFLAVSVANSGAEWLSRFDNCWQKASTHSFSSTGAYDGDDSLFNYCSLYAMGRACLRHHNLAAPLSQIVVWDEIENDTTAGTYSDIKIWTGFGYESQAIGIKSGIESKPITNNFTAQKSSSEKQLHAILFGDIRGFSKLSDSQIPNFVNSVMGCIADVLEEIKASTNGPSVLKENTWGDGLFIVLENVEVAAQCAIKMQYALDQLKLEQPQLAETAELRLGAHFGPVFEMLDPVTKLPNFFGEHVNRAARIEPITPPRQVYVTEAFAAQLALTDGDAYKTEYVGYMPMAKNYGDLPMYLLRKIFH